MGEPVLSQILVKSWYVEIGRRRHVMEVKVEGQKQPQTVVDLVEEEQVSCSHTDTTATVSLQVQCHQGNMIMSQHLHSHGRKEGGVTAYQ